MQFNISKCVHLPIINKKINQYSLFGHPLSKVACHSYLRVKLSWEKHVTEITSKSSKILGMVKRTLIIITRALLRLEMTMNLLEGGEGGEGRMGERGWGGDGGRVGRGRGGEREGGEGRGGEGREG